MAMPPNSLCYSPMKFRGLCHFPWFQKVLGAADQFNQIADRPGYDDAGFFRTPGLNDEEEGLAA